MPDKARREDHDSPHKTDTQRKPDHDTEHDGMEGAQIASDKQRAQYKVRDLELEISKVEDHGKASRITFKTLGHPIKSGVTGYVVEGDGAVAKFTIDDVVNYEAHARVTAPKSEVVGHKVLINPSTHPRLLPPSRHDVEATISKHEALDETGTRWRLTMTPGQELGVRNGMIVKFIPQHGPASTSIIENATSGTCQTIAATTLEVIKAAGKIVINPGK